MRGLMRHNMLATALATALVRNELVKWGRVIKAANIKLE
jgi:hypothetical protein